MRPKCYSASQPKSGNLMACHQVLHRLTTRLAHLVLCAGSSVKRRSFTPTTETRWTSTIQRYDL